MKQEEVNEIIRLHELWLEDEPNGKMADFSYEDLSNLDLSNLNLRGAIFDCTRLDNCNLNYSNLSHTSLRYASLKYVTCVSTNFAYADFTGANVYKTAFIDNNFIRTIFLKSNLHMSVLCDVDITKLVYDGLYQLTLKEMMTSINFYYFPLYDTVVFGNNKKSCYTKTTEEFIKFVKDGSLKQIFPMLNDMSLLLGFVKKKRKE